MLELMQRAWWLFVIRGIAAIAFGLAAFFWPGVTLLALIYLFGAYALIDGVLLLWALVTGDPAARRHAWAVGIMGVTGVVAAAVAFFWPGLTALTIAIVVGAWAIILGVFQIVAAIRLRNEISNEFWMALGGVVAILFGAYLLVLPGDGLVSLVWLVALWAIVSGLSILAFAFRVRGATAALRA